MDKTVLYSPDSDGEAVVHLFNRDGLAGSYALKYITVIGRYSTQSQCDIMINSPIVSRRHGEIVLSEDRYLYRDLGSTNGTYVNGKLYGKTNEQAVQLSDGDIISFEVRQSEIVGRDKTIALFTKSKVKFNWHSITLSDTMAELAVGRTVASGVAIDNEFISQKHVSFFLSGSGWAVIDHKSTNGVLLNGKRITSPRYLSVFDVIRIADVYFIFLGDKLICSGGCMVSDAPAVCKEAVSSRQTSGGQLSINIVERSVVQRFKKMMLLQDIRMTVNNGEMVLILGGSGAGKTTFINAVMGYEKADGKITYRDTDIYEEYEQMKYEIGFVPQQDLLRNSDTVYDTLSNAARMKLPKRMKDEKREERINNILNEFGLSRERDSLVSKLSGGQRKRLSIAVEFIANPSLFFLDEPDSGLDDIMGRGLMENLRGIADRGKIVMVITHSPERASDLFDKVIVLAKSSLDNSGHLAFYGTVNDAFKFFEVSSFSGIVKRINRKDENGEGLSDYYIDKYNSINIGE